MTQTRKLINMTRTLCHSRGFAGIGGGESDLDGRDGKVKVHDDCPLCFEKY